MRKTKVLKRIESLDPHKDAWEIVQLSVFYEFPWDFNRALELALYKTFAIPSISSILHRSGEFEKHAQKRYDDTDLILSELIENRLDTARGKEVLERLNWLHGNYPITNEDYLYVLSTFVFDSADWINTYAYRKLVPNEELAGFLVWKEIGEQMHIRDIPGTIEEFRMYHDDYERRQFQYSLNNTQVAKATEDLMLSWYLPSFFFDAGRPFLHAVMQPHLLRAFQYKDPGAFLRGLVRFSLRTRATVASLFPRKTPFLRTKMMKHRSYPVGYSLEDLGPEKLLNAPQCPFRKLKSKISTSAPGN